MEQFIIKQCIQRNLPLPERIKNAPKLHGGLDIYYQAFLELTTCRSIGFSSGPIPWDKILLWGSYNKLSEEQMDDLFFFVGSLDTTLLKHNAEKSKKKGV